MTETETPTEAEYRDVEISEADADVADIRIEGRGVIKNDVTRPVLVRRVWQIEERADGTKEVRESTHYYAASEPTQSAHVADTIDVEWETDADGDALHAELRDNLTHDPHAEIEGLLDDLTGRNARRKLGIGNQ